MMIAAIKHLSDWWKRRRFTGYDRVNLILNQLSPETRQSVEEQLCPMLVGDLWKRAQKRRQISSELELEALAAFLDVRIDLDQTAPAELRGHLVCALEGYVKTDPNRAADAMVSLAGARKAPKGSCELTPTQKAAILFMSLPPELSGALFQQLGPEDVQAITLAVTQLPMVAPSVKTSVLREFLGHSPSSTPLVVVLEEQVKGEAPGTAGRLKQLWLSQSAA